MFQFLTLVWSRNSCSRSMSEDDHFPNFGFVQAFLNSVRFLLTYPVQHTMTYNMWKLEGCNEPDSFILLQTLKLGLLWNDIDEINLEWIFFWTFENIHLMKPEMLGCTICSQLLVDKSNCMNNFCITCVSSLAVEFSTDISLQADITNLQKIFLQYCKITSVQPKAFSRLTNLVELNMSENELEAGPLDGNLFNWNILLPAKNLTRTEKNFKYSGISCTLYLRLCLHHHQIAISALSVEAMMFYFSGL